jgi:glucose/arabinose dehydrogenase
MRTVILSACGVLVALSVTAAQQPQSSPATAGGGRGQGAAGGRGATAPPPINWPSPPMPGGPLMIETALVRPVKVTVTKGLNQPWSMVFLPDASGGPAILVTERAGRLRIIRNGVLDPTPVTGLPADIQASGLAGLMDIQLHPRFADNKLVYLTYHKRQAAAPPAAVAAAAPAAATPVAGPAVAAPAGAAPANSVGATPASGQGRGGRGGVVAGAGQGRGGGGGAAGLITLARGRWDGTKLVDLQDIFSAVANGNASRILFARDGTLIMSVGYGDPPQANDGNPDPDRMPPQDPMNLAGKTLRLKDDGTVPPDNPFVGRSGYRPELYTLGHRNILGLTMNPVTGAIWSVENGPNGGDEVNELMPGRNYGWPVVNNGRFYLGSRVSVNPYRDNMEPPVAYWVPAIAASGMVFYSGDRFPEWKNNLFVGGMRQGEVPRSGHLERFDFNDKWEELHREGMFRELQQRIRDVRQGPDGSLYLLTAEADGALLRLDPGK